MRKLQVESGRHIRSVGNEYAVIAASRANLNSWSSSHQADFFAELKDEFSDFYPGAGRQELLNFAFKFSRYPARKSVVFYGPEGIGKTTLFDILSHSLPKAGAVISVSGYMSTMSDVLRTMLADLGIEDYMPASDEDSLRVIREVLLHSGAKSVVVLIDDAHEIGSEVLRELPSVLESIHPGAKLILFVGTLDADKIDSAVESFGARAIPIRSLSKDQVKSYSSRKFAEVNLRDDRVEAIFGLSNGIPEWINCAVNSLEYRDRLTMMTPENIEQERALSSKKTLWLCAFSCALLIAAATFLSDYYSKQAGETVRNSNPVPTSFESASPLNQEIGSLNSFTRELKNVREERVAVLADLSIDITEDSTFTMDVHSVVAAEDDGESGQVIVEAGSALDLPERSKTLGSGGRQLFLTVEELQLIAASNKGYRVQFAASRSLPQLERFAKNRLPEIQMLLYRSVSGDGTVYYKAVSELLELQADANELIQNLPLRERESRPWVKRSSEVQREIEVFRRSAMNGGVVSAGT